MPGRLSPKLRWKGGFLPSGARPPELGRTPSPPSPQGGGTNCSRHWRGRIHSGRPSCIPPPLIRRPGVDLLRVGQALLAGTGEVDSYAGTAGAAELPAGDIQADRLGQAFGL